MESLLIIPKNQTGVEVINTKIDISDMSDYSNITFTQNYIGDRETIVLNKAYTDKPLYMRVTKTFADNSVLEYADKNPVKRGSVSLILEEQYNTTINVTHTATTVGDKTNVDVNMGRGVDKVTVVVCRSDDKSVIDTKVYNDKTFTLELTNQDFLGCDALLVITSSLRDVRYRYVLKTIPVETGVKIVNLKEVYHLETDATIQVVANDTPYTLTVNNKDVPLSTIHTYDIRQYIPYGEVFTLKLELSNGTVIDRRLKSVSKPRGYNPNSVLEDVIGSTNLQIDRAIIPNPTNGDLIVNNILYVINEDNREKLYSYYIPTDRSLKLDPNYNDGTVIRETIHIDDNKLAIVNTGGVDRVTIYNYHLAPLNLDSPVNIDLVNYSDCKLTFNYPYRHFFYIEDTKLYKIGLDGVKTEITTPDTFTVGYVGNISIVEVGVILDGVLYSYDPVTEDWDTVKTLPSELISKTFKYMTSIAEGMLIVNTDGTIYKYDIATSDFVKFNSVMTNVTSVNKSNGSIFFTTSDDMFVHTFK